MRVRVGHRIGRRSWISVGLPIDRWLRPKRKTFKHEDRADRKRCDRVHYRPQDVQLHEAEMRGGSLARDLLAAEFAAQAAQGMRDYLAADRAKSEAWLGDIADRLD